jgi:phage baseplate assembly protein gpV
MGIGPFIAQATQGLQGAGQTAQIEHLNKVVKLLWGEVEQLRQSITVGHNQVVVKCGAASIVMKSDGTVVIKGNNITIEGSSRVNVKAAGDVVLKGNKILQN